MKKFFVFILLFITACTGNKVDEMKLKRQTNSLNQSF